MIAVALDFLFVSHTSDRANLPYWTHPCLIDIQHIYSRTSMVRTRRDHRCEFDTSMCSSDTKPDNFQDGSCVLYHYVITDITFFIDQSCKVRVTPVTDQ